MKTWHVTLIFVALVATGCAHQVTEQDLIGTWKMDPAKTVHTNVEEGMSMTLTSEHKFTVATTTPVNVTGTWAYDVNSKTLRLTPVDVVIKNQMAPQGTAMPISQALEMMKAASASPKMIEGLEMVSHEQDYEPAEGGKKLLDKGQPALVKSD